MSTANFQPSIIQLLFEEIFRPQVKRRKADDILKMLVTESVGCFILDVGDENLVTK